MSYHEFMQAKANLMRDACSNFYATVDMGEQCETEGALFSAEVDGQISCRIRTASGSAELVRFASALGAGACASVARGVAGSGSA